MPLTATRAQPGALPLLGTKIMRKAKASSCARCYRLCVFASGEHPTDMSCGMQRLCLIFPFIRLFLYGHALRETSQASLRCLQTALIFAECVAWHSLGPEGASPCDEVLQAPIRTHWAPPAVRLVSLALLLLLMAKAFVSIVGWVNMPTCLASPPVSDAWRASFVGLIVSGCGASAQPEMWTTLIEVTAGSENQVIQTLGAVSVPWTELWPPL